jgi:hypothetical protein
VFPAEFTNNSIELALDSRLDNIAPITPTGSGDTAFMIHGIIRCNSKEI